MSQQTARAVKGFTPEFLADFAKQRQAQADLLQSQAAQAQREADAARKELRRRRLTDRLERGAE